MEARELRLGNYVLLQENDIVKIDFIDGIYFELGFNNMANVKALNQFDPIPLTEEWLLKFGLDEYRKNIGIWNNGDAVYFNYGNTNHEKSVAIKHVHQLQNLYFALTNEELTINL